MQINNLAKQQDAMIEKSEVLISIIIATYNANRHIEECLQSIAEQKEKNVEVIIIDGVSTDNTFDIVKKYEEVLAITFISENDKGIYDAMNKGTALAKGRWYYFLGSDDTLLPGFSEMAGKLKDHSTVYYGNTLPFYHGNIVPSFELLSGEFSKYRLAKYPVNHQAILYPAKVFTEFKYNINYKAFADYALNLCLWGNSNYNIQFYPVEIARYNMTGFSSTIVDVAFKQDKPRLIKKNLGQIIYLRFLLKRWKKKLKGEKGFE